MKINLRFMVGAITVFLGLFFVVAVGLRVVLDIPITDLRTSTQFGKDLAHLDTEQYLIDDFSTYGDTQRIDLAGANDFAAYASRGMIVAWVDVKDYSQINSIDLELRDSSSGYTIPGIDNKPQVARSQNGIWTNDEFVDYSFKSAPSAVWQDWMLANGENLVFWEWNELLPINMNQVFVRTNYPIRDAFILKEFSESGTPTQANWIAPHGLIQYGFHYIEDGCLFMKNVRQTQMVTNGDHARIISNTKGTPRNFIMRVQFTATNIPETPEKNDYIRFAWDFEDEWDAGHDQTLIYMSGEYEYFGMQRVYPIIRQKEQGYENSPKKSFKLKNNAIYELDFRVRGQNASATIYEQKFGLLWEKANVEYTFKTPRPQESYPFSIEATGNPKLKVDFIEIREIF